MSRAKPRVYNVFQPSSPSAINYDVNGGCISCGEISNITHDPEWSVGLEIVVSTINHGGGHSRFSCVLIFLEEALYRAAKEAGGRVVVALPLKCQRRGNIPSMHMLRVGTGKTLWIGVALSSRSPTTRKRGGGGGLLCPAFCR
ncbi:hypothetical protein KP509_32G064900 [Ceratopteris richardii]|uniref:Uncharacterized protein n=1 Tax=Ceratopteris richardii TaxID=49495 RepID=A0A8T2QW78_CERRI|nr:hypothetical protein KP509_32G064900 [Ceratopteris richardii]